MSAISSYSPEQAALQKILGAYWPEKVCTLCGSRPASGVFMCRFSSGCRDHRLLCAACGLYNASHKWTGFFGPRLVDIKLVCTLLSRSDVWQHDKWALVQYQPQCKALVTT